MVSKLYQHENFDSGLRRRASTLPRCALVIILLVLACQTLSAQTQSDDSSAAPIPPNALPDILSEGTLQPKARLFLSDRNGTLVLVTEESAEEYFRTRSKLQGAEQGLPVGLIESVEVDLRVGAEVAQLSSRFDVQLTPGYATSVSLKFGGVQWTDWDFSGAATNNRLQPISNASGWRWTVLSEGETNATANLRGVCRVTRELERRSLRFALPTAPCSLNLTLPSNATDIRIRSEDVLKSNNFDNKNPEDYVKIEVASAGGDFSISWTEQESITQIVAVNAKTETTFEVGDPNQPWMATTTLSLRWYGENASNQIVIELPPGGQWRRIPNSDPGRYQILTSDALIEDFLQKLGGTEITEAGPEANGGPQAVRLLLENLNIADNESLELTLDWDWAPAAKESDTATEVKIPSPLIQGVDRHSGTVDCIVASAYAVVFKEGDGARLIYQGLMDALARQQLQFEFDRQPFDVKVIFRPEQSLPTVRPTYLVHVDRNKLTMTMWFDCSFENDQPQLELILDEWVIQENTARVVNDPTDLFSNDGEVLRVQQQLNRNYLVRNSNWDTSNFNSGRHVDQVWRVVAERSWTAADKGLYFQVPQIIRGNISGNSATDHGSGAMLVTSDSNVLLDWQEAAGTGLQRDSFSTEYEAFIPKTARNVRKPLVYHFQSSETTPRWAGKAELLPRQASVIQHANINVSNAQVSLEQNFDLQIANEPVGRLRFAVRKDAGFQEISINGNLFSSPLVDTIPTERLRQLLSPSAENTEDVSLDNAGAELEWQVYEVRSAPELLGANQITITSSVDWKGIETPQAVTKDEQPPQKIASLPINVSLPLAQLLLPSEARKIRQDWSLSSGSVFEVVNNADNGLLPESVASWERVYPLAEDLLILSLQLKKRQRQELPQIRIKKCWLQSFVNSSKRRERFVAQVEASANELRVKLPSDANMEVQVSVNALETAYDIDQGVLRIPLNGNPTEQQVVEISYFLPDSLSWTTRLKVSPPTIFGTDQIDHFYWQLITPSVHHLACSASELTAEWTWQWSGWWWERKSSLGQKQLEEWISADTQDAPPASANSYVMGGPGTSQAMSVWVLSRFVLWFPVGLVAIAISFVALNFPGVRRPVAVYAMAVLIAGLATLWPDMAVLAAQTAAMSLGLVALVWVTQAAVDARARRRSVFSTRSSTYADRSEPISVSRGVRSTAPGPSPATTGIAENGG